ncbi:helix-turn-helix transcriptional regulator [Mycobacterium sp. IEC1808]|uniref:LuxR C-terminal-related transcriptional regulator n=1 Tax=Mycobacterium sp. IEC1808 TaxID=1743230 RepID=UPI000A158BC9|nr:LuxR family transcriptional regulator [Mycobacterium sp. IEC1808]ORW86760.1 helix-turn-helix transcriptional regulator [Mycobacterium sp. IEC1808]
MRLSWPLTGRAEELRSIGTAIADPDSAGILVCGAAGVGKSRVAREALAAATSRGCVVRWVVGTTAGRLLPFGALSSWTTPAGVDSLQLVRAVIEELTAAPNGAPVVIGVDDAHLLDDLSTFALQQIVQRAAAKLVLTARSGEPIPPATQELWTGSAFDRLDVQPLSEDETTALVSTALGGPLDPHAAEWLWRLTRGNPLYLRNIVEREFADGRLVAERGCWHWTGEPVLPPSLLELVDSRIGAVPPAVSDVVDLLAVGEPIELGSLARITDAAAVEEADLRSLVTLETVEDRTQVRLAHPLYAEVRRQRTAPTRLRRLRGLVAAELGSSEWCDDMRTVVRRAALSLDSDLPPDADLLLRAAQGAVWLADLPLADRLAEAAIRSGAGPEANFVRAHALSWLSRGQEADDFLADIPLAQLDDLNRSRRACLRAVNMLWSLADGDGAKQHIDDARATTSPRAQGSLDAACTMYWAAMGQPDRAMASARNLDIDLLPAVVGAVASWGIVAAAGDIGRASEAVAGAERAYAIAVRSFDAAHMRFVIADVHLGALLLAGRINEATCLAEHLAQEAANLPGAASLISTALAGRAALGAGRLDEASGLLPPVVDTLVAVGEQNGFTYRYRLPIVTALATQGLGDDAAAALATLERHRHPSWRYLDYERGLAKAWVAACQGAVSEAIDIAVSVAEIACANGQFAAEVVCLQTATQFGDTRRAPRLRELETVVEGPRAGIAARFAAALHAGDGAELETVSVDFEEIGDVVAALDAAAHAAIAYRRGDLRGSALKCSTRADALAEKCGGAHTPALRQASERLPLTDREREIVMLLGQGLSGRAVAERLTLSVRTVEGHIYRAMAKTGAASRDELAGLLRPDRSS